ncbi:hypothetical protein WICMUC_004800 [Wickerhamomyces mucosus]|uniref:PH domain-containing protein n=1 Tax=Wickerhamomyces mucosus TaxID=1378264 RepID=A0A9P8T9G1_9ASCO|nr:hypothetical protein WICMUC_004800 [Wickerhamomyces mucosus]
MPIEISEQLPSTSSQPLEKPSQDSGLLYENEFSLYTKTLTFNVIGRYDPQISQLLYHTSHCQLYKLSETFEWEKQEYNGVLAIYSRIPTSEVNFDHGLIILNRTSPENYSLGLISNEKSKQLELNEIKIDYQNDYLMIKNLDEDVYGFWIHEVNDRETIYKLVKTLVNPEHQN